MKTIINNKTLSSSGFQAAAFFGLCGLLVLTRAWFFVKYNLDVIDSDQFYMWQGAHDFASGVFMEPRYYGQSYNTFMEALLAVPFTWMKVPVYIAVPLATHLLALFPPLFAAAYLYRHRKKPVALLLLALCLCLPSGYDFQNILPRGFITGLFFCSFFICSLLNPQNFRLLALNFLLAALGYFVNPNSVIVSVPFMMYLFLHHFRSLKFYGFALVFLLWILLLSVFFDGFYKRHPGYAIHPLETGFDPSVFIHNISNLDQRLGHVSYFINGSCAFLLLAVFLAGFLMYRQNKKAFIAWLAFLGVILFSFTLRKIMEGSTWVFVSQSRMYLGIPVFIYLFVALLNINYRFILALVAAGSFFTVFKLATLDQSLEGHFVNRGGVRLVKLSSAIELAQYSRDLSQKLNTDFFMVSSGFWVNTVLSAAGPALFKDYPATHETWFEKRYWVREKYHGHVVRRFLLQSTHYELDRLPRDEKKFRLQKINDAGLFLVSQNTVPTGEFIKWLNVAEDWHPPN